MLLNIIHTIFEPNIPYQLICTQLRRICKSMLVSSLRDSVNLFGIYRDIL